MNIKDLIKKIDSFLLGFWKGVFYIVLILIIIYVLAEWVFPYEAGKLEFFIDYYNNK